MKRHFSEHVRGSGLLRTAVLTAVGLAVTAAAATGLVALFDQGGASDGHAAISTTSPSLGGQVSLSSVGSDSSCSRGGSACATFNRAYQLAHGGDTVVVHGGLYPEDSPTVGGYQILPDPSKTGTVTFVCAGDGDVTFAGPVFNFWAGLNGVTFQGGCFHFHVVFIGLGGYTQQTSNITLNGVHMDTFNISGALNVTIENSEVGPFVACYEPGDGTGAPSYATCNTSDPAQAYWASQGGTAQMQQEPFVHNGGAGLAQNVTLLDDTIHGISSTWSGTHTGGLIFWGTQNLHIIGSTFANNAIYDVFENQDSTDTGLELENNTFGIPVYSFDPTEPNPGGPLPWGFREVTIGGLGSTLTNVAITSNRFVNGLSINPVEGTFVNVEVIGNILGKAPTCPSDVIDYDGNVSIGHRCGLHSLLIGHLPYRDYAAGDYRLPAGSRIQCFLAQVRAGVPEPKAVCTKPRPSAGTKSLTG